MNLPTPMWLSAVVVLLLGACSHAGGNESPAPSVTSVPASSPTTTTTTATATTTPAVASPSATGGAPDLVVQYRPGLEASLYRPASAEQAPVVVMVPGGGWRTADPSGYAGLAAALAEAGLVAVTVEVGAAENGAVYPAPVEDIHCAVAYATSKAVEAGIEPGPVVVLGHSSGAHLAALAALDTREQSPDCPHPPAKVDALIGLAGVYDVDRLPALAYLLFAVTPEQDPETWEEGNPLLRADLRPELPVLLLHGAFDSLVPVSFTQDFATALEEGGHETTLAILAEVDHGEIILAEVSGQVITEWIMRLPPGA